MPPTNIAESPCTWRIGRSSANQRSPGATCTAARRAGLGGPAHPLEDRRADAASYRTRRILNAHLTSITGGRGRAAPSLTGLHG